MKTKLLNNLLWKVLSVFAAILLWLIVVNIDDTIESDTMKNLQVSLLNTDVITSQDQTYRIDPGTDRINLTVYARRTELAKVKASDFVITADMKKDLRYDSMVKIEVSYTGNAKIDSIEQSRENVLVSIEEKMTEQFKITVDTTGQPSDGLEKGTTVPEKSMIEVSGPKSIVEQIRKVVAKVNITGITGTAVLDTNLELVDGNGDVVDDSQLEYLGKDENFSVTVTTLNTKRVGISFDISSAAPEGYSLSAITYKPETVIIAGAYADIRTIYNLNIPAEALNPEQKVGKIEQTVDISQYLPENVMIPEEDEHDIVVTMEIVENDTVNYSFTPDQIDYQNTAHGLQVDRANSETAIVPISGLGSALAGLTSDLITVTADMSGVSRTGTYTVPVRIELPDGFTCPQDLGITVHVISSRGE